MHASQFTRRDYMKDQEQESRVQQQPNNRKQQYAEPKIYQSSLCFLPVLPLLINDEVHSIPQPNGFSTNQFYRGIQLFQDNVSMKYKKNMGL
jgi:hypothetical protein